MTREYNFLYFYSELDILADGMYTMQYAPLLWERKYG